jgi:hypothetical protein
MRYLLLACSSLLLASCVAQHQLTPQRPPKPEVISLLTPPADATASTAPYEATPSSIAPPLGFDARGKVRIQAERKEARVLRRWHRQFKRDAARTKVGPAAGVPNKCKGCTFNLVAGNQTNAEKKAQVLGDDATNTQAAKKSGPIIKADSGAKVNTLVGPGNLQATNGNNNTPTLTALEQQAADWRAMLAKPIGKVAAGLVVAVVVGGTVWGIVVWRKKKALQNLV